MKHFMLPKNGILKENMEATATNISSTPNSMKQKSNRKQKRSKENAPPSDPNSMGENCSPSPSVTGKPSPATAAAKMKSPLPPRPPSSNPLKRKMGIDSVSEGGVAGSSDSGVQVIVRMRPPNKDEEEGEMIAQKISNNSLSIRGQPFTFDSVADNGATQLDIFELVGAPLVENSLSGFNSSVFAYGQTGSGKTYTIWGPANVLLEDLSSDEQGLAPRVFERLFSRIDEEQIKHAHKELVYQCRCSFLEIYNEQITDLLDPSQRNLLIREDVSTGVYVENLTEECVSTTKDVKRLLIKGLSNRRTGATSINAESSRSHSVFTCVVESRCKTSADDLSCFKRSRINLVDLAGSERQKLTGAAGERLKEAGNINRSLSQLGNLINILAEVSQTGKQRHIPYRDSKLTFLLQESLGGNAKLAMICAISPAQSCMNETFSTLRFAQRAKAIKNKAVVNEEMQDDVNILREVIRQLKDELLRMKANGNKIDTNGGYTTGWSARRSLNLLKFSLNRPVTLPHLDDDSDEEMEIVEEGNQICFALSQCEENSIVEYKREKIRLSSQLLDSQDQSELPQPNNSERLCIEEQVSEDTDVKMEEELIEQTEKHEIVSARCGESDESMTKTDSLDHLNHSMENVVGKSISLMIKTLDNDSSKIANEASPPPFSNKLNEELPTQQVESPVCQFSEPKINISAENAENGFGYCLFSPDHSTVPRDVSTVLKSPTPSVSPTVNNRSRKSVSTSSISTASQKERTEDNLVSEAFCMSFAKHSESSCLNLKSSQMRKSCFAPTEHLAASLHHGLEIIDSHHRSSALRRSSYRFSCKPAHINAILPVNKVDVGIQTLFQDNELLKDGLSEYLCSKCKNRNSQEHRDDNCGLNLQLVPVDEQQSNEKSKMLVPKAVEKVLAGAIRREMALEDLCAKKTSEIMQLNRLVQQYKYERECNSIIGETREDKIVRLESLMDGVLSTEDFLEDELVSLKNEHMILKEKYENHPELLRTQLELKRVRDELDQYRNFFEMGEKDVLLEEIQDLRSQLQYYVDSSPKSSRTRTPFMQLTYPYDPNPPPRMVPESTEESAIQKLERERLLWMEAESKWISLAEELRSELEASKSLTEKQKQEIDTEKRCSEELKEAMQMAMEGHVRMIEQYADLEEKHIQLLGRHRKIQDGIDDVKKAAARAGVRGAESKFINALAAEISALKVEREKERRHLRDENKGLQAQLRDTAEAVQAAGELLVRLKEAEEAVAAAEMRAIEAEQEVKKAYKQMDKFKKNHEKENSSLNLLLAGPHLLKEASGPVDDDFDKAATCTDEQRWREEFEPFYNAEEKLAEPSSWFSGYDRCNI